MKDRYQEICESFQQKEPKLPKWFEKANIEKATNNVKEAKTKLSAKGNQTEEELD